jgi:hypothetical protein
MLYLISVALHVITAVLVVGLIGAIPLAARFGAERLVGALLRTTQFGFLGMLITGILLDVSSAGNFHHAGWFRASVVVLVLVGAAHSRARAALKANALRLVERWGWAMCAGIAVITLLMQTKLVP